MIARRGWAVASRAELDRRRQAHPSAANRYTLARSPPAATMQMQTPTTPGTKTVRQHDSQQTPPTQKVA